MRQLFGGAALATFLVLGQAAAAERLLVTAGASPSLGPPGAPVTLVEFVDYQ